MIKGHLQVVFHVNLGLAFSKGHETGLLPGHAFHEKVPHADEKKDGHHPRKQIPQKG